MPSFWLSLGTFLGTILQNTSAVKLKMLHFEFWDIFFLNSQQPLPTSISLLTMKNSPEQVTSFTCETLLFDYIGHISADLLTKTFLHV
jgi:hypothetical protein